MSRELEWPLRGWDAVEAGNLTVRELRRLYVSIYPGVHVPRGAELCAVSRAQAAWLWSRQRGVVAGLSASAMLGSRWIEPGHPAELMTRGNMVGGAMPDPRLIAASCQTCHSEIHGSNSPAGARFER